jgi:PPK2 family polyphosphate:nucleotide phosphotransferase
MNYLEHFQVVPETNVDLHAVDPAFKDHANREQASEKLAHYQQRLRELQEMLYVERRRSLLICLQAMDTGGKDGTIDHVLSAMNPQGCRVAAFRRPSEEEAAHDFLWRAHRVAPAQGEVVVFNRSHYEDVLIVRVHDLVPKAVWSRRYERINAFEQALADHGTLILKFYLHISKAEQLARFKARLDDPTKHWKLSEADYAERERWDDYMAAYEAVLSRCSTPWAPWFVIPADHKGFRNLAVAQIVVEALEGLQLSYPKATVDLDRIRREYEAAARG